MNPFMMSNMFFGPMGMSVTPFCGCGISMPYYGMNDSLTFMNFPIFRNTSSDYLLDPRLAMIQCQQSWMQPGNMYSNNFLPLFNNFPGINPWWQPKTETPEEKKAREEREAEEKKPENIEKKAKVDEYKSYFEKLKSLLDTDTKNSADFKELESQFNEALKEKNIDNRVEKLEKVFKRLDKETLTKVALADKSINSKLYEIGYNFPGEISKLNESNSSKDLDNLIATLNLSDSVAVGAFGPTAIKSSNNILHIISSWNDTHNTTEKGIIRGMAKHMPKVNENDPVTVQQQYKAGIEGVANALIKKADEFANANGGAKSLPKLCKQIETTREKLSVIEKVDYNNKERVQKSDVNALADEFDKLYVMLRLVEADVMNQKIINKYGKKMNELIEGAIPEDIIIKETKDDLAAEGFKTLPTSLDKIDIKESGLKIKKSIISADEKYEKKQDLIDKYLADEENGVGVLTKVGDSNVYVTKTPKGKEKQAKYYTVSDDNKLVECDKDGNIAENAPEVKAADIEKYVETLNKKEEKKDKKSEEETKIREKIDKIEAADFECLSDVMDSAKELGYKGTCLSDYFVLETSKGKRYFKYENGKLVFQEGVSGVNSNGTIKLNGKWVAAKTDITPSELGLELRKKLNGDTSQDDYTRIDQILNTFASYTESDDIIAFIEAYNKQMKEDEKTFITRWNDRICAQISTERNYSDEKATKALKIIARQIKRVMEKNHTKLSGYGSNTDEYNDMKYYAEKTTSDTDSWRIDGAIWRSWSFWGSKRDGAANHMDYIIDKLIEDYNEKVKKGIDTET